MSESIEDIGRRADAYSRWLREVHTGGLARRSARANASFLLPHLRPGLALLDAGCGPGTITVGLARAVAPAPVLGVDLDERSITEARTLAEAEGATNTTFRVGSVYETGLADATFDIVFCHAVLQHLVEPARAVQELVRVLRPGGMVALVDADHGISTLWPESPALLDSNALVERLRRATGASPRIGRELGALLREAGCIDVWHRTRESEPVSEVAAHQTGSWQAAYLRAPEFRARVAAMTTPRRLDEMAAAWEAWGATPGAFWARPWCEALARRPGG